MELNIQESINDVVRMKRIHVQWAEHFETNPDEEKEYVATGEWDTAKEHRKYVEKYNKILNILKESMWFVA